MLVCRAAGKPGETAEDRRWKGLVDQSYEAVAGTLSAVYGEKEYGGTQVLETVGRQFREGQHARPAAQVLGRHVGNHPAHAVRRHDHADRRIGRPDLGAKRNVVPEDDEVSKTREGNHEAPIILPPRSAASCSTCR